MGLPPESLPALARAQGVLGRAQRLGLALPAPTQKASLPADFGLDSEEGLGELLLAAARLAQERGFDAEAALQGAVRRIAMQIEAATRAGPPSPS